MRTGSSGECVLCCLFPGCVRTGLSQPIRVQDSPPGCLPSPTDSASVTVGISPASQLLWSPVAATCIFLWSQDVNSFHFIYNKPWIENLWIKLCVFVFPAPKIQADCVSLLALLRRGVCETWRVFVFSKTLQSSDEVVRAAAVRAFPLFLHHLGNAHHNLISSTLL